VDISSASQNRGIEIGVTLHHPHGQIYAFPFVAAAHQSQLESARRHAAATAAPAWSGIYWRRSAHGATG